MLKIRRPLGRLIFNMGIAIPGKTVFLIETAPRWANDRDVARLQAKTVTKNLIWSESVPRLRSSSSSVRKIPGALPSRPWACPLCPHAQITIPRHIYRTKTVPGNLLRIKSAQWLLSSASERFQKPLPCHGHAHYTPMGKWPWRCILQANTVPMNLILNKSAHNCRVPRLHDFRSHYHGLGHAHHAHMGKWSWRRICTGLDGSNVFIYINSYR